MGEELLAAPPYRSALQEAFEQALLPATTSTVALLETILTHAYTVGASDIHIDPGSDSLTIRLRVDGQLEKATTLSDRVQSELISRIKILAGLRTDEHAAAQDGRFKFTLPTTSSIDVRVSITPTYYGENAVLRLLTQPAIEHTLSSIGFSPAQEALVQSVLSQPHGLIIVTGATGSGKTTTLYTLLRLLQQQAISIITIEDPIEYSIPGVNQIPVHEQTGLTFTRGLRSILRQDPDVIMVGEIRDSETARLAIHAALTGHLVLSTLHTTNAATAIPRLFDLGIEPYLISSTLRLVISQRLLRALCKECARVEAVPPAVWVPLSEQFPTRTIPEQLPQATGCAACQMRGYDGRTGIFETLPITHPLREAILERVPSEALQMRAVAQGMHSLYEQCFDAVLAGTTTLEELFQMQHE